MRGAQAAAIRAPVANEPVKKTPSTGWSTRAAPVAPAPVTTQKTSVGTPAACSISPIARPVSAANSEGL